MAYVFVANDAFAMSKNLLKPYGGTLDRDQQVFNYLLSRARRVPENAFGILSARFGVLRNTMQLEPEKATSVTLACCYLHNFQRKKSKNYFKAGNVDWDDENYNVLSGEWRERRHELEGLGSSMSRNIGESARCLTDSYRQYFCTEGKVPWQDGKVS